MRRLIRLGLLVLCSLLLLAAAVLYWQWHLRLPQREGQLSLPGLQSPVVVRYDEAGVPHIRADNEADLYRALGYVHAQDRLFQMEIVRRLARGELAEVLGPKLVDTDKLFRTLRIRHHADAVAARLDAQAPAVQALQAYLAGVNAFQDSHPAPIEFALLGIPKRPFTAADTLSVAGYLAYSFAAAFRTEPALTRIRDQLGPDYLRIFDLAWYPDGVAQGQPTAAAPPGTGQARLTDSEHALLARLSEVSQQAMEHAAVPLYEGSNAWVVSGARSASAKPMLAGDPHIAFGVPAVWYEAHLSMPGFELYGLHQALNPFALVGHNRQFGWSLTMFQNDDVDFIAEKTDAAQPGKVWHRGQWVALESTTETIGVKGAEPVSLTLQRSPHGPIVNAALGPAGGERPIAMWWAMLETENPVLEAFYRLDRADTLDKARAAAALIHAPGLNVVWANAAGDIGWWAAARLPERPAGVNPSFVLDGASGEADKPGFRPFSDNPQEENPARGYIVSANHQPAGPRPIPGYYNLWDRAHRIDAQFASRQGPWDMAAMQALQLDTRTGYGPRVLAPLLPALRRAAAAEPGQAALVEQLAAWTGDHPVEAVAPTVFHQFLHDLGHAAMADEIGEEAWQGMRRVRALDHALPRLAADVASPWWDRRDTPARETRDDIVALAWQRSMAHLTTTLGDDPARWVWARAHAVEHEHPLGKQKPLDKVFNVGPFPVPGGREVPNNLSGPLAPVPVPVTYGPSTRRVIDFADPASARGANPVGQSGVWGDQHYADQAAAYARGESRQQHLAEDDVARATMSTLTLQPTR